MLNDFLAYAAARLKEPSTYAGLAGIIALLHISLPGWAPQVIEIVGMAAASVIAIVLPQAAPSAPPSA